MHTTTITSAWDTIIQYFFPVFTVPTAEIFLNLVTGWILCTAKHTITGILPFADPNRQKAHDAYHRFFPDSAWAMSELWKFLTILLVRIFYPKGVIITDLDDTLFHRSGIEFVALLCGLAVVSSAKIEAEILFCSALVSGQVYSELRRCLELPSPCALAG